MYFLSFYRQNSVCKSVVLRLIRPKVKYGFRCLSLKSRIGLDSYEEERKAWRDDVPLKFNFASNVIDVWAEKEKLGERNSSIPAFWYVYENGKEIKWNYQIFQQETKKTANMLRDKCEVKRGDNIMVLLPKVPEFWLLNIAAIRIGCVLCPGSILLTSKDLAYRFSTFKPTCIIAHDAIADRVDEVADKCPNLKTKVIVGENEIRKGWLGFKSIQRDMSTDIECISTDRDESMMVFFTSGTTGFPKMVEHSHNYGYSLANTGKYLYELGKHNIMWNVSDTGWAKTAYGSLFAPWSHGSCVFVHQMPRFCASTVLEVLSKYPIDTFCAPPTGFRMLVQENLTAYKFPKLEHCVSGGESVYSEVMNLWEKTTGLRIYEGYGQTETILTLGMFKCLEYRPGSIGKPAPGIDVTILDDQGQEMADGEIGEICIRKTGDFTFGLFMGYKGDESRSDFMTSSYYRTGDLGYRDKDGYFWFAARKDDIINSAGYRIGPSEVESALMEHPEVVEAAVVSSPDSTRGEVVKAFILLKNPISEQKESQMIEELQNHTKRITAPFKYPRKIEFVAELPKTVSGKIKRSELKKKEWAAR